MTRSLSQKPESETCAPVPSCAGLNLCQPTEERSVLQPFQPPRQPGIDAARRQPERPVVDVIFSLYHEEVESKGGHIAMLT